jgi:hypothetical protein
MPTSSGKNGKMTYKKMTFKDRGKRMMLAVNDNVRCGKQLMT